MREIAGHTLFSYLKKGGDTMENTTEAARLAYNAYIKAWRKAHPDKVREHNRRYWEKKAARMQSEAEQQADQTAGTEPENKQN